MRFGPVPLAEAEGAIAAHSIRCGDRVIRKGTRLAADEIAALSGAGHASVVVARLEADDVPEDTAAHELAQAIAGPGLRVEAPFTGRSNLFAQAAGVIAIDRAGVDVFNGRDEALTLATIPDLRPVQAGDMVATVKIIPFAVPAPLVREAARTPPLLTLHPFVRRKVALVSTLLPGLPPKVVEKTRRVTAARLAPAGAALSHDVRIPHDTAALAQAIRTVASEGADLVLIFGASAITDRRDVIPAALEAAGGRVERLGMPVDPGNLTLIGRLGDLPVIGAPGCARSAKENGFDWLLMRLLAGLDVTAADVAGLGVGGLLGEIVTRPQLREEPPAPHAPEIATLILAAGRGIRMGGPNKLLADVGGTAVVRRVAEAALAAGPRPVVVVTGHEHERVEQALAGLAVQFIHNPDHLTGMASSLRRGIAALSPGVEGAVVALGDMPLVSAELFGRLGAAFAPELGRLIVVPMAGEQRGNPVLLSRRFFPDLMALEGDIGARRIIAAHPEAVVEVEAPGAAAFLDVDTPQALDEARALLGSARGD